MSSTKTTKGKAPAISHSQEDTITITSQPPPPTHSTRSKGKNAINESQAEGRLAAHLTILSGSRAVNKGTPVYSIVEDIHD